MRTRGTRLIGLGAAVGALLVAGCTSSHHPGDAHGTARSTGAGAAGTASPGSGTSGSTGPTSSASGGASAGTGRSTSPAPYPTPSDQENPPKDQSAVLDALPGSAAASCAAVGTRTDLRSGSVAMGNFASARKQYLSVAPKSEVPEVNLYVIPQDSASMTSATVTIDPKHAGPTKKVTTKSVQDAGDWRYFAVQLPVPAPGSYRLTVVAGSNRGCFDVTFGK